MVEVWTKLVSEGYLETVDKKGVESQRTVVSHPVRQAQGDIGGTVTVRVNLLNIGNLQVLTIPGEALPNIGCYLKRKMRGEHAMLFGLTNDALGYILTRVDFQSFPRYDYVSRVSLGEETGEILLKAWLDMVERAPVPENSVERAGTGPR